MENRNRPSLVDSFLIAIAKTINGVILTTDETAKGVAGKLAIHIEVE